MPEPALPADGQTQRPPPHRARALAALWLALVMAVLDAAIANIALPTIAARLHIGSSEAVWIVNSYQLAILVSLLPVAALGDILQFRRVFTAGLVLFSAASLGCALSQSLLQLTIARALQGLGAAGIMSVNGTLLRLTVPKAELGKYVGLNAVAISIAAAVGPTIASSILSIAAWPWLFAINVPIGLVALAVGRGALPDSRPASRRLDWVAAGLNIGMFALLVEGADLLAHVGGVARGVALLGAGFTCGVLLFRRSLMRSKPLVPVDLLRNRLFSMALTTSIASYCAQMLAFVAFPFHLQLDLHRSPMATGLLMTPWPVAGGLAAAVAGRLADRYPAGLLSGLGLAALAAGLLLLTTGPAGVSETMCYMALCGLGFGFFQAPNNHVLLSTAPMERSGAASGMMAVARLTGMTAGATGAAILLRTSSHGPLTALGVAAAIASLASAISFARVVQPRQSLRLT